MTWQTVLALGEVQAGLETRKEDVRHVERDVAGGRDERGHVRHVVCDVGCGTNARGASQGHWWVQDNVEGGKEGLGHRRQEVALVSLRVTWYRHSELPQVVETTGVQYPRGRGNQQEGEAPVKLTRVPF